jgi:hypothetical protein
MPAQVPARRDERLRSGQYQMEGRKRRLVVDILGLLLAVAAADRRDRDAAIVAVAPAAGKCPTAATLRKPASAEEVGVV